MKTHQQWFVALVIGLFGTPLFATGPHGTDDGWVINDDGSIILTASRAQSIAAGKTGWLRIEFRLIPGHSTWDATMLSLYDIAVNNARNAGLQVLGLVDYASWPGSQADWCANNKENTAGNGDNTFVQNFANNAVVPLVQRFRDRIKVFEIWNEPSTWASNPSPGVYTGGSFVYPSNFSWMLNRSWLGVHVTANINDVTLISGGVFGVSPQGAADPYGNSGGRYIDDTYNMGVNIVGSFSSVMNSYGTYPVDGIGQHIYIDAFGSTTSSNFRNYEDQVRNAYTKYEGTGTAKKTFITEFGWSTANVSQNTQDANLVTSYKAINSTPYVKMGIWFRWQDVPAAALYFGVLDANGSPKVAYNNYTVYQTFEGKYADGVVHASIQNYFNSLGAVQLGTPYDNGGSAWVHQWYDGKVQDCNNGAHTRLTLMCAGQGTFQINDQHGIWTSYVNNSGVISFGYPTSNEYAFGSGTRQDFQEGNITWTPTAGIVWTSVPSGRPKQPTNLSAVQANQRGRINLSWTQSVTSGITQNKVYRSTTGGGPFSLVATLSPTTSYSNTGLTSGTRYFYVVTGVKSGIESFYSAEAYATAK
jgi:hypothetical protein